MESVARAGAAPTTQPSSVRAVLLIITIATVVRLALAACVGLSVDESYTVAIGRQFALSYFDHPPLHVWLVGAWAKITGREDAVLVRLPFIVLFAGSTWLMYRLTASAFGERAGFWAVLVLTLTPLFTVGTGSWVLPDGPLVFFSLLAVWVFTRTGHARPDSQGELICWLAVGAAAGLALLSKYLAVFFILGLGLFLLTAPHRRKLATPAPWLALILAAVLCTPVVVWNAAHGWVSLSFQGSRALPQTINIGRCALDLAGQLAYLFPWTAAALVYAVVRALRHRPRDGAQWLFACLSVGPVVFFAVAGLWTPILPHWPAIGWIFTFPLLGNEFARIEWNRPRWLRGFAASTGGVLLLLLTLTASQASTGWMDRFVPGFPAEDPTNDVLDWSRLKTAIESRRLLEPGMIVATVSWIDAGKVDYALGGEVPVLCLSQDPRQFAFLRDARSFRGRDAIIVANARRADWRRLAERHFDRIETLQDVELTRAGHPALTLRVARGIGLKVEVTDPAQPAAARVSSLFQQFGRQVPK